jgi:hypothetical protein
MPAARAQTGKYMPNDPKTDQRARKYTKTFHFKTIQKFFPKNWDFALKINHLATLVSAQH